MITMITQAIEIDKKYLDQEGSNELDRSFYEGRIEALKWVLREIESEG
jgi:hypothetical protein